MPKLLIHNSEARRALARGVYQLAAAVEPTLGPKGMSNNYSLDHSAAYIWFEQFTRLFSPYQLNPFDINPLRDLIAGTNDFDAVNRCSSLKVFVTATNVRTGRAKVFTQPDLSVDTVMQRSWQSALAR